MLHDVKYLHQCTQTYKASESTKFQHRTGAYVQPKRTDAIFDIPHTEIFVIFLKFIGVVYL